MKRLAFILVALLAIGGARAQTPSPAQMGVTSTTTPEVLQVLDRSQTWVPIGNIDPVAHVFIFTPPPASSIINTPSWPGAISSSAQDVFNREIHGEDFGVRPPGSLDDSRVCATIAGINTCTVSGTYGVGDLKAGDDVRLNGVGLPFAGGTISSLSATPCGMFMSPSSCAAGTTSCTYSVQEVDDLGGRGPAASVSILNAPTSTSTQNNVHLTYQPSVSDLPGAVYRNCGSGDVYLGAAQSRLVAAITPGSGYVNGGPYLWTATGGGCAQEPRGFIVVVGGAISTTYGRVEPVFPGKDCTSPPTVTVPAAAGGGTGGAITLSLISVFDDTGVILPGGRPDYLPAAHDAGGPEWLIAGVGAINATALTLCQPGTGGPYPTACVALNPTQTASAPLRHSWTRAIQAAINAASNPATSGAGQWIGPTNVEFGCGSYEIEGDVLSVISSNVMPHSPSKYCAELSWAGVGPMLRVGYTGGYLKGVGMDGFYINGSNAVAGYAFDSAQMSFLRFANIFDFNSPCNFRMLGGTNVTIEHTTGNNGWAAYCDNYDVESTATNLTDGTNSGTSATLLIINDGYYNDGTIQTATTGITTHNGWHLNDVFTIYAGRQAAMSDASGHGWLLEMTSGYANNGSPHGVQGFHGDDIDAEFSKLDDIHDAGCEGVCYAHGSFNGARLGWELYIDPVNSWNGQAGFQMLGGKLDGATLGGAYIGGGYQNEVVNTYVQSNSVGGTGLYAGIEVGPGSQGARIGLNNIGSAAARQSYPVQIDAGAQSTIVANNIFGPTAIAPRVNDLSSPGAGTIISCNSGSSVPDCNVQPAQYGPLYKGIGDLGLNGLVAYLGLRCVSNAFAGSVIDITDAATGNTTGTRLLCSPGGLMTASNSVSACTFVTGGACSPVAVTCASGCNVEQWYDQIGTRHFLQASNAARPAFLSSGCGFRNGANVAYPYCVHFAGAQDMQTGAVSAISQPIDIVLAAERTANLTSQTYALQLGAAMASIRFAASANNWSANFGSGVNGTALDSAWHTIQGEGNGAAGATAIDVSIVSGQNLGTEGAGTVYTIGAANGATAQITGNVSEFFLTNALNGPAAATNLFPAVYANQQTYLGL
jgi:hypothetical protein